MNLEDKIYIAKQINRAVQLTIQNAEFDDALAMEVADLYPEWEASKEYKANMIVRYGVDINNETQLFRVLQDHVSQESWNPAAAASLFKTMGIADDGIPVWVQPYGASDAYQKGDHVHYPTKEDAIYESLIDENVWSPDTYPAGWAKR